TTLLRWFFFFSSRRRHTRFSRDWSSDVCSSDLGCEVDPLLAAVQQPHVHLAEVELRELAGHALEAHHERSRQRRNRTAVEPVERALAEPHPFFAQLTKDLERRRLRVFRHERDDPEPHPLRHARPADGTPAPLLRVTRTRNRRLLQDPLDGALR